MPEPDPKAGRAYIWTISCILFICIAAGGGCLLAYMTIPDSQSSVLLPALGFTLVCLPWIFWITTVIYRITSRAFGFRMVIGSLYVNGSVHRGGGDRGGGGGAAATVNDINDAQILDVSAKSPQSSPENDGRHVQFGEAMVLGNEKTGDNTRQEGNMKRPGSSSSSSSNDISVTSHESEMPLALSMAS
ncbi:hypothetical protein QUC31_003733 [Theobroma cacao]|uniref:Membrane lipoprotein, putative n=1 Tax=Theobroma cacao TaxID=3641 RepID=A0A061DJS5_THECC|nr:Membrane lipoprotein, putative [Theobroma cacao]WRX07702.1 hypothetical protein QQP08_000189 [Theobroma cacao]